MSFFRNRIYFMVFILYFKTNNVTAAIHRIEYQKEINICMDIMDKKLELKDLYIGMEIRDKKQLSGIYDTWIMLVKNKGSDIYTIGFIGRETNEESDRLFEQGNVICPVYNDSMELEGDIYYEE